MADGLRKRLGWGADRLGARLGLPASTVHRVLDRQGLIERKKAREQTVERMKASVPHDHAVVTLAQEAGKDLGRTIVTQRVGGGSDANIFFGKGIMAGVPGYCRQPHHLMRTERETRPLKSGAGSRATA